MSGGGEEEGEGGIAFVFEVRRRYLYPVLIFLRRSLQQSSSPVPPTVCAHTAFCLNLPPTPGYQPQFADPPVKFCPNSTFLGMPSFLEKTLPTPHAP